MERVVYQFLESDDDAATEGKFEAVVDVVCNGSHKSDVIPSANGREVNIVYIEGERAVLEPVVLAILRNSDGTFWSIAEAHNTGKSPQGR